METMAADGQSSKLGGMLSIAGTSAPTLLSLSRQISLLVVCALLSNCTSNDTSALPSTADFPTSSLPSPKAKVSTGGMNAESTPAIKDGRGTGGETSSASSGGKALNGSGGGNASGGISASGGRDNPSSGGSGGVTGGTGGALSNGTGGEPSSGMAVPIDKVAYVFSSFTDNGEDGLHLIASYDGFSWAEVDNYRSVYQQGSDLMRDPSVVYGPDGLFHMVWTTGWWEQNIAVAHSTDLIDWEEELLYVWADYAGPGTEESDGSLWPGDSLSITVPANSYVRNSWAPEIFYDDGTGEYVIYWSSTIDSAEVFPETWGDRDDGLNHRIYFITTRDFQTYTRRRLFYQPSGRMVIDAFVCKLVENDYQMVIKDEASSGYGNLHIISSNGPLSSWAEMPSDFWSDMSTLPFAGEGIAPDFSPAEGPGGILIGDEWYLYADYWMDGQSRAWRANDFADIQASDAIEFPFHLRHGTLFQAPRKVVEALLAR